MAADRDKTRGFVLVLVLWMLILLALVGHAYLRSVRGERIVAATDLEAEQARLLADGAIRQTVYRLALGLETHRPLDGTEQQMTLFGQTVLVSVQSEKGRIDLNAANPRLLDALLASQGLTPSDAETLVERIIAWRTPVSAGQTVDDAVYLAAGRWYGPRHGRFRTVGEARLVLGMTGDLFERVRPLTTVFSQDPGIDRGVAPAEVLRALAKGGDDLATQQLAARVDGRAAGVDRPLLAGEPFTIRATVQTTDIHLEREAILVLGGADDRLFSVLDWR